jgi:hypothetical protein
MIFTTEFWVTLAVFSGGASLMGWMVWLEKHPPKSLTPRLFPTTLVLVLAGLVALMAFFHLVDMVRPVMGR